MMTVSTDKASVPQYYQLLNPVLSALRKLGGSATIRELDEEVTNNLALPGDVVAQPHGNRGTELEYRLAWARTYLKKYGLLDNSARGVWVLTPEGRETDGVDPDEVKRHVRQERQSRKQVRDSVTYIGSPLLDDPIPLETEHAESWREQLLSLLQAIPPATFERLCQRLLRESGFVQVQVTGRSGDGGIDGVGIVRIGGLLGFPVLFQCKRYAGSVGPGVIRDFRGAMIGRADRGLVITTGTFSRDARAEATRDGAPPIDLVDGEELIEKLKDLRLGVDVKMIEEVTVRPMWFEQI